MEKTFVRTNEYFMEFNSYLEDLQNEAKKPISKAIRIRQKTAKGSTLD